MIKTTELADVQRIVIGHGALLILVGGVIGFGYLFFLLGRIELWPFPGEINYQLPGSSDSWRMAHLEGILNGLLLWLTAAILPILPFSINALKRIGYGMVIVGYTIVFASAIDPLMPNSRGLEMGGPTSNSAAFLLFYVGIVIVMVIMGVIAYRCLKPSQTD